MPAPSWDREASCDDEQILRNEATDEFVSGPLSVVSGPLPVDVGTVEAVDEPNAMNKPVNCPLSVVSCPLPVGISTVEAVDEPNAMNEPSAVPEIAMNPPTEDPENAANEPTDGGSDLGGSEKTGTDAPPEPISNGGGAGSADREPDPAVLAEIERLAACSRLGDEIARRAMIKADNIRKLDEQWWREAEAAEAACRARSRKH